MACMSAFQVNKIHLRNSVAVRAESFLSYLGAFWGTFIVFPRIWERLGVYERFGGYGRIWDGLEDLGNVWARLTGFGNIWEILAAFGSVWEGLGEFKSFGELGSIWEHY